MSEIVNKATGEVIQKEEPVITPEDIKTNTRVQDITKETLRKQQEAIMNKLNSEE